MAIYSYVCGQCGKSEELYFSMSEGAPWTTTCSCGGKLVRDLKADVGRGIVPKENISDALAVHPKQIKEFSEDAKRRGLSVEFLPDGRAKFKSNMEKRRYAKAYGFHNKDDYC